MPRSKRLLTRAFVRECARKILRGIHPTVPPHSADVDRVVEVLTLIIVLARRGNDT